MKDRGEKERQDCGQGPVMWDSLARGFPRYVEESRGAESLMISQWPSPPVCQGNRAWRRSGTEKEVSAPTWRTASGQRLSPHLLPSFITKLLGLEEIQSEKARLLVEAKNVISQGR